MRTVVAAALGMLSLVICSSSYANITVQNTARPIAGANPWDWSIYLAGSPQEINQIHCVTYHLHPTFPNPNRQVCDNNPNPQHAFVLSTKGWGTFVVKVDVLFKDGTVLNGQHLLSFSTPVSAPTLLASAGHQQPPVPPSTQQALASPRYVLTVGNMTPFDGVSSGPNASDTDYLNLTVKSSSGDSFGKTIGPNDLRRSANPTNWNLSTSPIAVPANSSSTMTISVTVTNRGHFKLPGMTPQQERALEEAVRTAIANAVAKGITAAGAAVGIPIPDQIAQALAKAGVALVYPNCDMVLFSPLLTYDGATLNQGPPPGWSVEGPNKYHVVLDYGGPSVNQGRGGLNGTITEIPPHCDPGVHYNIELHLTKI